MCVSYEEEDTCVSDLALQCVLGVKVCHMRRRIHVLLCKTYLI
jgi:hypothetical protein